MGPFAVPIGVGFFGGAIQDISWDAGTGSLLACDVTGVVGSFLPGALPVVGPYGFFPVAPGPCGLAVPLTGIALDKALPGTGTFYVTDGALIAYLLPGGGLAPPTFYTPASCFPSPGPVISGLSYAGRQLSYGTGLDSMGFAAPTIGSVGQSYVGTPAYSVTIAGSIPTSTAFLDYNPAFACPPTLLAGLPIHIGTPLFRAGKVTIGAGGGGAITAPIPPTFPFGMSIYLQWIVITPTSIQVSDGGALTLIAP